MAVYVDEAIFPFRGMLMCHMVADTLGELHEMADQLGIKRAWFQPTSFPHYDLHEPARARALELGAVEISRRQIALFMRRKRAEWREVTQAHDEAIARGAFKSQRNRPNE